MDDRQLAEEGGGDTREVAADLKCDGIGSERPTLYVEVGVRILPSDACELLIELLANRPEGKGARRVLHLFEYGAGELSPIDGEETAGLFGHGGQASC